MATTNFTIDVYIQNADRLPELQARLNDLSPAFEAIIPEWAELNPQKFGFGKGKELSGVGMDDVFWTPLSRAYLRQKHPAGPPKRKVKRANGRVEYPDWLMVRTGQLMQALSDPDMIHQAITPHDAAFGTPLDAEDAMKVRGNWMRRQTVFLSLADQNMIRRILQDYLGLGPGFSDIRKGQSFVALASQKEEASMNQHYDVGDTGGEW